MVKTFNFIEVVNSGKRFRPVHWSESVDGKGWYSWFDDELLLHHGNTGIPNARLEVTKQLISYDYDLEEKTITINESQFDDAWNHTLSRESNYMYLTSINVNKIKKELGF